MRSATNWDQVAEGRVITLPVRCRYRWNCGENWGADQHPNAYADDGLTQKTISVRVIVHI